MARYQRAPTAAQPQTQLLAKAQRRVDRWKKAYWGDVFTIIALSLLILGLAAASIAQASSQNSSGALVGVFAWNIVLAVFSCPATYFLAKKATVPNRGFVLWLLHILGCALWISASIPILTVGLWSGQEAQFRKRGVEARNAVTDTVELTLSGGTVLGCCIGGLFCAIIFLFNSFFLFGLRAAVNAQRRGPRTSNRV